MKRLVVLFYLIIFLTSLGWAELIPGQIVVKFKPGVITLPAGLTAANIKDLTIAAASLKTLNTRYAVTSLEQVYREALKIRPDWKQLADYYLVKFNPAAKVVSALADFQKDPNVLAAYPNTVIRAFATTPNDPYYDQQWGLTKIQAPQGWDRNTGTNESLVAVLDTGLNYNHADFANRCNLTYAKDFINGGSAPLDDYGHGTAVSGVIGAATNNNLGVAGLDWNCQVLPIKVLDSHGSGSVSNVNSALAYLTALKTTGVNIVSANMSLGQYTNDLQMENRCSDAHAAGIILVAAAGNGNIDWNTYPACYTTVLAVAATDSGDIHSVWSGIDPETGRVQASNYGEWVDVSAPGSNIFSTDMSGSYSSGWNGTSLASPYVAGLAALIKATYPAMTSDQISSRIKQTATNIDDLNPSFVGKLGTGRINVYRAIASLSARITAPTSGAYVKGKVAIIGTAGGWNFAGYTLEAISNGSVEAVIARSATSVESSQLAEWDTTGRNGDYTLRLLVAAQDGSTDETTASIKVNNTTPEVAITSPLPLSTAEGRVTILGRASDAYLDRYLIEYGEGTAPTTFQKIGTFYAGVSSGPLATWETAGLSGFYTLRITAYNLAGTSNTTQEVIYLSGAIAPTKEVEPQSGLPLTFALPNPFDRQVTAEVALVYNLEGNFNTTVYLFDLSGNQIWQQRYLAGENGGKAGRNNPGWNGRDLYGGSVNNGIYLYQIVADQRVIGRGKIVVLN